MSSDAAPDVDQVMFHMRALAATGDRSARQFVEGVEALKDGLTLPKVPLIINRGIHEAFTYFTTGGIAFQPNVTIASGPNTDLHKLRLRMTELGWTLKTAGAPGGYHLGWSYYFPGEIP